MSKTRIYLDNAATSWPKPDSVYQAVDRYQRELGAAAGRGVYGEATEVERLVAEARNRVARLIGAEDAGRIVFGLNGTDALNLALQGLLCEGDHVVTTVVEHNSVLRPLRFLEEIRGISVTRVECNSKGVLVPEDLRQAVVPKTRLIVMSHASNVTGAIQPANAVGKMARELNLKFLVDAAQSLGHIPVNVRDMGAHFLAAPGHKGLLGPLGTGILYIAPGLEAELASVRQGGTGTQSNADRQPNSLPDKYEAGNLNVPGIVGLGAGAAFLEERHIKQIRKHEQALLDRLLQGLLAISGVTLYGPCDSRRQVGVVSLTVAGYDPQEVAALLDSQYAIQCRAGLHCAPLMHEEMETAATGGTVRLSTGPFNTLEQIEAAIAAIAEIAASAP